jgi:hypothetical protein
MALPQVADGGDVQYIYLPLKEVYHGAVINFSPRHIRKQNQQTKKEKVVEKAEWKRQFGRSSPSYPQIFSKR